MDSGRLGERANRVKGDGHHLRVHKGKTSIPKIGVAPFWRFFGFNAAIYIGPLYGWTLQIDYSRRGAAPILI